MLLLLARLALAAPAVSIGTSVTGGLEAHAQGGVTEPRGTVDLLDLEIHVGDRWIVVPRIGRWAAGVALLEIQDIEVDVLLRWARPGDGWQPLWAIGIGPKLAVGAADVVGGARLLGRLGATHHREDGIATWHLFGEPYLLGEGGRDVATFAIGLRAGFAVTWRVRR